MQQDIRNIRQGDEYTICIDMGDTFDLSGYKAQITMRVHPEANSVVLSQASTAGDSGSDVPARGLMYITIPSSATGSIESGSYCYDIRLKRPGAEGDGIITLLPSIEVPVAWVEVLPQIARSIK